MNDHRAFRVLVIPDSVPAVYLTNAYADADQAAEYGAGHAARLYPNERVEVVVIHTATREAVRNVFVEPRRNEMKRDFEDVLRQGLEDHKEPEPERNIYQCLYDRCKHYGRAVALTEQQPKLCTNCQQGLLWVRKESK